MAASLLFTKWLSTYSKQRLVAFYLQDSGNEDHPKPSEDAILDSLFYACDESNVGSVAVSKLITYLRNAISNGTEEVRKNSAGLWDER